MILYIAPFRTFVIDHCPCKLLFVYIVELMSFRSPEIFACVLEMF